MKNKKCGYYYLKKKAAKLEEENATLVQQLHEARDMWSDANAQKLSIEADFMKERELRVRAENDLVLEIAKSERLAENTVKANEFIGERYVWLYEHAPFWLKWWFKYTFKGAVKHPSGGIVAGSGKYEDNINRGERVINADELQQIAKKLQ